MSRTYRFRLLGLLALTAVAHVAAAQSSDLLVQTAPVGLKPLGIALWKDSSYPYPVATYLAAVANSGDDSISILKLTIDVSRLPDCILNRGAPCTWSIPWTATVSSAIHGIPSPYAVAACRNGWLVTSPSSNSVSYIDGSKQSVIATVKVGAQPHSALCEPVSDYGFFSLVSNYGDSSLSVIDSTSHTVTKTIPNVPGARSLRGISQGTSTYYWVAGTDADMVTRVDVDASKAVLTLPIRRPSVLQGNLHVASAADNSVTTIDGNTLQVKSIIRDVPTPQDLVQNLSFFGLVASTGSGNSLFDVNGAKVIATVAGAAGLADLEYFAVGWKYVPPFLLVTSPDSNSVYLVQIKPAAPDAPHSFAIAQGASFATAQVAPGSLASAFVATGATLSFYASSLPMPRVLGGVTLRIGGSLALDAPAGRWVYAATGAVEAPLLYVGPNQINFQVPPGVSVATSIPAQLSRPDGTALVTTTSFAASAPGIFTLLMNGQGQAVVLNQDNTVNFGTNPARRGSLIQIFATGAGETTPALAAGEAAPAGGNPLVLTKVQPTVTIGGKNAKVQFSGMAPGFVGLWQINAEVPADVTPGMALPLVITAAGASSNTVTIAVQ
ncbi:MAG: hypothetical protein NTZ98_05035 [Acidobacteria bacterium]|nr:hypothetical protein [Acidobacteriota bacterium]